MHNESEELLLSVFAQKLIVNSVPVTVETACLILFIFSFFCAFAECRFWLDVEATGCLALGPVWNTALTVSHETGSSSIQSQAMFDQL
jgi:hypothetical protein